MESIVAKLSKVSSVVAAVSGLGCILVVIILKPLSCVFLLSFYIKLR